MDNRVWLILRPHYSPSGALEKVGICGSGFFINKGTFVTSYHILNESSFIPNAFYFNKNIFLVNPKGKKIEINVEDVYKFIPELDITIIKIDGGERFLIEEDYNEGDYVKNLGYPERYSKEILEPKEIRIKNQFEQEGKILKIYNNYSMNANDVKIFNKEVIILDYTSELGFSGGPLLKNKKVIGVMSHIYPQNKNAVAISIKEIKKHIQ
ncbi:MAG: hypothetical protein KatS3mg001_016 [Candidatus Pacearchaeota archaeon]|nr:MAG: hypothetical protein KatS3mg001_016 [Candidatus Pacearchaeota archaeon]